ncbi:MAG: adenylate kinase [Candidatus Omnitrophica bacterium]|nr:adenylate kinase [Candidatus Omnitrophota bacterium]MDD5429142.1 adenylate kinase [Candidatus Omnitrophota bacterium]
MKDDIKIILFGAPGSGKGTQAVVLAQRLGIKRISLGDILRDEVKKQTSLGLEVKGYMEKGLLVPDELVSRVIEENIDRQGFILDGYPRTLNQAKALDEILGKHSIDIDAFVVLDVDEETVINRLSKRRVCKACGAVYHLINMPSKVEGVCDVCGGELIQRKDDNMEVIKKRWEVFNKENKPLLDFYQEKGKVFSLDGRKDKDEVFEQLAKEL